MKYMLDANICIYALNRRPQQVLERVLAAGDEGVGISSIVAAELAFGVSKSQRAENRPRLETFLYNLPVLPWTEALVWDYGEIRWALERTGQRIGERDLFIAAHARALDLTLVTNNLAEFQRVPGLKLENWGDTNG